MAGWSPFCFLSRSFIFTPQHELGHRDLPSREGAAGETLWRKQTACVCLYAACMEVDPVRPLCDGCLVAFSLDGAISRTVLVCSEMGKKELEKRPKPLEKKVHLAPKARSQIYNIHLYKESALWFLSLIPSISPFPTSPLLPSLSSRSLTRAEECYPLVAGHPATRRQERRKREPRER